MKAAELGIAIAFVVLMVAPGHAVFLLITGVALYVIVGIKEEEEEEEEYE